MYRKIVWCYVLVLTLLDISLNTKLTAQGKSHDITVHDSLIEGISFQEWGKEAEGSVGVGAAGGNGAAADALRLSPRALRFGRAALGAAHALTVTLTNTHNSTVHLASVAGTTPDFHASFFESKTLPPNGNTSFSVVYLGRREGPVTAHLYIHTSLGVHKYPVSAEGVASEWGVWPLVGLRVPHNATLDPLLTLYNPTDKHIQVREVYSSGSWVGLQLPGGGGAAPREAWRVPPHTERALVRLRLRLPAPPAAHAQPAPRPLQAYIRIKGDNVGGGSGLVVGVEATAAAAGEFLRPPQLRLRTRGSRDPPHTWDISAGNSGAERVRVQPALWGAACGPAPVSPPPPPDDDPALANGQAVELATHNGAKCSGATVRATREYLEPHQEPENALQLTLDYARLWASHGCGAGAEAGGGGGSGGGAAERGAGALWCGGWVRAGGAALPYSVRLLPGTLALLPPEIEVVTAKAEEALKPRDVRVRNEFPLPLRISAVQYGPDVHKYFHTSELTPLTLAAGASGVALRLRLRDAAAPALRSHVTLVTNVTAYTAPLLLHSGTFELEWEWPNSSDGHLRLGGVGAGSSRLVALRLRNASWRALCVRGHAARLAHAQLALEAGQCVRPGGTARAWLRLAAPARPGALRGAVWVSSQHAAARAPVSLTVHAGRMHALQLAPLVAAPYAGASAPLELESTMTLSMRVLNVTQPDPDPAITFVPSGSGWVSGGRQTVGAVHYEPERACAPTCYTGLDLESPEGVAWLQRGADKTEEGAEGTTEGAVAAAGSLADDVALLRARRQLFARLQPHAANVTLYVHTTEVLGIPVTGTVRAQWPRLRVATPPPAGAAGAAAAGGGALAGVGGAAHVRLRLRNPAARPLLLHAAITHEHHHTPQDMLQPEDADGITSFCKSNSCVWSSAAFRVTGWRAVGGAAEAWPGNWSHAFLLAPAAEIELTVTFAPAQAAPLAAYLYLRNNLTILEIIPLWGRGAYPSFELGGRRPGSTTPLLFEVSGCGTGGGAGGGGGGGGVVRRTVWVRNTGAVGVRLREWRVAGRACQARGFRLQPCAPLALPPNDTRALRLAFAPDYTLARAHATLRVRTDLGSVEFTLAATAPARLLRACAAQAQNNRPPFEPLLRACGTLVALGALALVLAAAALDAERSLRRARAARAAAAPARAPLDLRAAAAPPPAPRPPLPPRRRRAPRRPPQLDPHAERRAFERWRAEVLRRAGDDDHSSEEADAEADSTPPSDPIKPEEPESRSGSPPTPDATRRSSDEDAPSLDSSVGSDSSRADEREPDDSDAAAAPAPAAPRRADARRDDPARPPRLRREASEPPRRSERRTEEPGRPRLPANRCHGRREAARRRRGAERAAEEARPAPPPAPEPRPPPALRWGASWSSVVAAGSSANTNGSSNGSPAPLPPIGSDVRRRAEERGPAADHSLFYFNGDQPAPADAFWRPPPAPAPPYTPPTHDYLAEYVADDNSSLGGGFGSVWAGAGGAWAWGGGLVRPPPGFSGPPPPPPRAYDPFRSLAAIWAPGALDWRPDAAADAPDARDARDARDNRDPRANDE